MALTRLGTDAIGTTLPVSKGGTGVTTSADLANTGNMVLIKSVTADNDSVVAFDDGTNNVVLDTTYKYYKIFGTNIQPATDNVTFRFRFRNAGSAITSGYDYTRGGGFVSSSWVSAGINGTGTDAIISYNNGGNADGEVDSFEATFGRNASLTNRSQLWGHIAHVNNSGDLENTIFATRLTGTTNVDGLEFRYSSGNVKTGTFSLYGVKD